MIGNSGRLPKSTAAKKDDSSLAKVKNFDRINSSLTMSDRNQKSDPLLLARLVAAQATESSGRVYSGYRCRREMTDQEMENQDNWLNSMPCLSVRARNLLRSSCICSDEELLKALESGEFRKRRGVGRAAEEEMRKYLGLPKLKSKGKGPWRFNPWTGEEL